ncbi:MAG: hypothetical protein ABH816_03090 [Candidatus Levyibacteriota bacterium]
MVLRERQETITGILSLFNSSEGAIILVNEKNIPTAKVVVNSSTRIEDGVMAKWWNSHPLEVTGTSMPLSEGEKDFHPRFRATVVKLFTVKS